MISPANAHHEPDDTSVGQNLIRFAGWGALWGLVLGFGVLAPGALLTHRLRPQSFAQWCVLDGSLAAIFAVGGLALAAPTLLAATDLLRWQGVRFREGKWAIGLGAGPAVVLAYAVLAWLIGRFYLFDPATAPRGWPDLTVGGIAAVAVFVAALVLAYRAIAAMSVRPPIQLLAWSLSLAAVLMVARLPGDAPIPPPAISATSVVPFMGQTGIRPLLFVGLDGGTWSSFDRLIAADKLPAFKTLLGAGTRGEIEASWPPFWSSVAWAAVVTGQPREATGIYEDLSVEAPGLPLFQAPLRVSYWTCPLIGVRRALVETGVIRLRVPPREALKQPPFWETLTLSSRPTAIVRMPFSYPAQTDRAAVVVSDWAGVDWQVLGVTMDGPGPLAAPPGEAPRLLEKFAASTVTSQEMVSALFPAGLPSLSKAGQAAVEEVSRGFTLDTQTLAAASEIAQTHPGMNVALYLGGWDTANHALWRYRPEEPTDDPATRTDAASLNGVLDRYLMFLDRKLQDLQLAFASKPNVVLVSDHGFAHDWHEKHAMFLASGPDVPFNSQVQNLSYFDVVPTLFDLVRLEKPTSLRGHSILAR
jgi:type I phosphodiesterase/nucleotide pyrophosphatase